MNLPHFEGWHLIGAFPDGEPDDVGSWILHHGGEAALLEVPPGLTVQEAQSALRAVGATLRYIAASHEHEDHFDRDAWRELSTAFRDAKSIRPRHVQGEMCLPLGGEPLWLVKAPKHSRTDVVTIFRGVAMTGDIELGMLRSVNREVPARIKRQSMAWLRGFQERTGYHVHTVISAHLNDVRCGVFWPDLFGVDEAVTVQGG